MGRFEALNPQFEALVRASFVQQGFMRTLGAQIVSLEPGACAIAADFNSGLSQQHGYFHAGVAGAIADSACGYAAFSLAPPNRTVLAVEYKLNLMAPMEGSRLVARAEVIRPGRTLHVCRAEVFVQDASHETHCATSLATIIVLENERLQRKEAAPGG